MKKYDKILRKLKAKGRELGLADNFCFLEDMIRKWEKIRKNKLCDKQALKAHENRIELFLSWCEKHFLKDEEFFKGINLRYKGLEETKIFVEKKDLRNAKKAFGRYIKNRVETHIEETTKPDAVNTYMISEGFYKFGDYPYLYMGKKIDWDWNPIDDIEWPSHLQRHENWYWLARTYLYEGKREYADEALSQLLDWVKDNPVRKWTYADTAWSTLNSACRCGVWGNWVFRIFKGLHNFNPDFLKIFLSALSSNCDYLIKNKSLRGNWLVVESVALFMIGSKFPELKLSKKWRNEGLNRLKTEIGKQVYEDGAHEELCVGYHCWVVDCFRKVFIYDKNLNKQEDMKSYSLKIEKMYEWLLYMMDQTGCTPAIGDDKYPIDVTKVLKIGHDTFGRQDILFGATNGKQGKPPEKNSYALSASGHYTMRSGWTKDDIYLLFDCAPFGGWHSHRDLFNIVVTCYGKKILVDSGCYSYADEYHDEWGKTKYHNTVVVDDGSQDIKPAFDARFDFEGEPKWVSASHENYKGVRHTRKVVFVENKYWIIEDNLESGVEHKYDWHFHFGVNDVKLDKNTGRCFAENLLIVPIGDVREASVFDSYVATGYGRKTKKPVLRYTARADNCRMKILLYPYRDNIPDIQSELENSDYM